MHPYNAKQTLLQHLHDGIPPLDGQTLPESWHLAEIDKCLLWLQISFCFNAHTELSNRRIGLIAINW